MATPRTRRPDAATTVALAATLHLALRDGEAPSWRPATPLGGWSLSTAEAAARGLADGDPEVAAQAFDVLVCAAGLGRLDVAERLGGHDRRRRLREVR
ncbi:hypothetical protein [Amnibacterium kyonggiense]